MSVILLNYKHELSLKGILKKEEGFGIYSIKLYGEGKKILHFQPIRLTSYTILTTHVCIDIEAD